MITLSKIKGISLFKKSRILKILQFGAKTVTEAAPFGLDSSPLEGMTAIFAETSETGDALVIGYINKNQLSNPGEYRMYSLKQDGSEAIDIYLKNDGTCELGGNSDSLVKYNPLMEALINSDAQINQELEKIRIAISSLGGSYLKEDVATDISDSKSAKLMTS